MNLEIEHNGRRCTKALIDGKPFGKYVEGLDIHIEVGKKLIVIMKTRVDTLKINGQEVQIYREKSKINIKERILKVISKIRKDKENGKSRSNN